MIREAIILAGGLGTRLRETVPELPKSMAPVAGRPFLFYVINYLRSQEINRFIFSLGYQHELIEKYLAEQFSTLDYECSIETEPLGTGGAIQLSLQLAKDENILITNGDTVFKIDVNELYKVHMKNDSVCTIALKSMENSDRYGTVELDQKGKIKAFTEKKFNANGLINGGFYILNKNKFSQQRFPEKFSFEEEYLQKNKESIFGYIDHAYFIDIGIPEDYFRAETDFRLPPLNLKEIEIDWTLFLDRDGVLNYDAPGDYIRNLAMFHLYDHVPDFIYKLNKIFSRIFIVSNQRGVGRGIMKDETVQEIHRYMLGEIEKASGHIDRIYYSIATENTDPSRKPNPGIAFQAKKEFPEIRFNRSIMVGNKPTDMGFGKNAGMYTVFVATTDPGTPFPHPDIDLRFDSFEEFVKAL